jgi:hypothetical protein
MMDNWNGGGWGWEAWFAMGFMMLVFWGAIVAVVIVAFRSWGHLWGAETRCVMRRRGIRG